MADLTDAAIELVNSITEMPGHFADVATHDPLNIVLIGMGALFVTAAVGALGYLSLGAFFDLFTGKSAPPQQTQ
jgi:hypothetical protein